MSRLNSAISLALGAAFISFAAAANAGIIADDCTGCSIAQIQGMMPECNPGRASARYVSDFAAGRLYLGCYTIDGVKINATNVNKPMTQGQIRYHWYQPDASFQNTFDAYNNVYQNNGHVPRVGSKAYLHVSLTPKINLGADNGYLNAYDTVRASSNNDQVLNWLDSTKFTTENLSSVPGSYPMSPAFTADLVNLMNAISTAIISFNWKITVTIVFDDGSTRDYALGSDGLWKTVANSAKDGHGNPIPEKYDSIANNGSETYSFSGGGPTYDQGNFVNLITLYGVPVTNGSSSGTVYGCVQVGSDHVTCTQAN
jgi:hypothetical protein